MNFWYPLCAFRSVDYIRIHITWSICYHRYTIEQGFHMNLPLSRQNPSNLQFNNDFYRTLYKTKQNRKKEKIENLLNPFVVPIPTHILYTIGTQFINEKVKEKKT